VVDRQKVFIIVDHVSGARVWWTKVYIMVDSVSGARGW
jgi:hypothetical protein